MKLWQLAIMIGFGGSMGVCGWCVGYGYALRNVKSWMTPPVDKNRKDITTPPPMRDRRFNVIEHRSRLS